MSMTTIEPSRPSEVDVSAEVGAGGSVEIATIASDLSGNEEACRPRGAVAA